MRGSLVQELQRQAVPGPNITARPNLKRAVVRRASCRTRHPTPYQEEPRLYLPSRATALNNQNS